MYKRQLYNYIDQCLLGVRNIDLPLRVKRKSKAHRDRVNRQLYGMSIEQRPSEVENREEFGHGEIDKMCIRDRPRPMPKWLEFDTEKLTGKIVGLPERDDIDMTIEEHLIVELYSK